MYLLESGRLLISISSAPLQGGRHHRQRPSLLRPSPQVQLVQRREQLRKLATGVIKDPDTAMIQLQTDLSITFSPIEKEKVKPLLADAKPETVEATTKAILKEVGLPAAAAAPSKPGGEKSDQTKSSTGSAPFKSRKTCRARRVRLRCTRFCRRNRSAAARRRGHRDRDRARAEPRSKR